MRQPWTDVVNPAYYGEGTGIIIPENIEEPIATWTVETGVVIEDPTTWTLFSGDILWQTNIITAK